jgi:dihydrofolate reductase (trimethoprim resistance protein)
MTHPFEATLNEIEAGLEGVTPGVWEPGAGRFGRYCVQSQDGYFVCQTGPYDYRGGQQGLTRAHIARCHPLNMAEMIRLARLGIEVEAGWFWSAFRWPLKNRVRKIRGSSWQGRIVGFYSTTLTPEGYAVESEREPGSVQIYPAAALELVKETDNG